jgi:uncharacterized protein (TIGR03905 family)
MYSYTPIGVCSNKIDFEITDNKITNVIFTGGCSGNLKAVSTLIEGMSPSDVIKKLEGIKCGSKNTSCADQLSKALKSVLPQIKKAI